MYSQSVQICLLSHLYFHFTFPMQTTQANIMSDLFLAITRNFLHSPIFTCKSLSRLVLNVSLQRRGVKTRCLRGRKRCFWNSQDSRILEQLSRPSSCLLRQVFVYESSTFLLIKSTALRCLLGEQPCVYCITISLRIKGEVPPPASRWVLGSQL